MPVSIEVLRSLNNWIKVDLGPLPYEIKSNVSKSKTRHYIEDEDGNPTLMTLTPNNEVLPVSSDRFLFEIDIKELTEGEPVLIEGILPGSIKSELIRVTRE